MKFILARHGETQANIAKIYSGWSNYELTEKGTSQIKILAEELRGYNCDFIYASPLGRTMETAREISKTIGKKIIVDKNLREMNFGVFEGKTADEIQRIYPKEWDTWLREYQSYRIPEGESLQDVLDRAKILIDSLKDQEGTAIIVSHSGVIQSVLTDLLNLELNKMWHFTCPPAGYIEIDYINNFGYLRKLVPSYI
ncbi:histidine phosphatase family protein [Alkaliphilus oremlandii]|uniref:Phosphoglycerate mutase n=1 Tax=Alkaliphilus oremlandii (strain OhILAs) TaxID=350688 RepID=A8MIW1_ALKOO|nr:histidine phosphatase family protein [Alkaliphilus oremlandii]ABW19743.1 Phosphoglycerate mutase [Alkaliphilus oremlandii OhILAs]